MKPSPAQVAILAQIEHGVPRDLLGCPNALPRQDIRIASYQWSRDGDAVLVHRTILTEDTGNPRLDFRVEMFRIQRDGTIARL